MDGFKFADFFARRLLQLVSFNKERMFITQQSTLAGSEGILVYIQAVSSTIIRTEGLIYTYIYILFLYIVIYTYIMQFPEAEVPSDTQTRLFDYIYI